MATAQLAPVVRYLRTVAAAGSAGPTDGQLLARFVDQREEAAFAALVGQHGPMVLAVCRRVLPDWHAAEDAFQATFLVLARKARSLGCPECLGPWLHGVAYRTAIKARADFLRRRARERQQPIEPPAANTTDEVIWRDLRPVLDEEVSRLPVRYRVPFILCYLDGLTNAEAARRLGCSRGTVATWLARARERLRGRLTQRGVALSMGTLAAVLSARAASAAVPAALAGATARAAILSAAGALPITGLVSPHVAPLTKGVLRTMLLTKLKIAAGAFLGAALLAIVAGGGVRTALATEPDAAPRPVAPPKPVVGRNAAEGLRTEVSDAYRIHVYIRETDSTTGERKLLSRPQLMTLEGQTAVISIGGQLPVVRSGDLEYLRSGGFTAQVKPTACADGTIRLALTFEHARPTTESEQEETGAELVARRAETVRCVRLGVPVRVSLVPEEEPARTVELIVTIVQRPGTNDFKDKIAEEQAAKDLKQAEFYERTGHAATAYFQYDLVRRRYPGTPSAERAAAALRRRRPPARVGQIIIVGNVRTSEAVILKELPFKPGQLLDYRTLRTAEQNLARLGVFQVSPKEGVKPTVGVLDADGANEFQDILINVKEK